MKNSLLGIILLLAIFSSCKKPIITYGTHSCAMNLPFADSSLKHPKNATYSQLINNLTTLGLPGVSLMIEDSSGLWMGASGYADIENGTKMQNCHLGKIASVTKLFTAVMIYKLVEQGKIHLDDKISNYIDEKHISKIENADNARIRDLLSHSSGIYDVVFDSEFILYTFNNLDKEKSYEKLLSFAYGKKAAFDYNTKHEYNQTLNHVLLAMIINKITRNDQSVFLRNEILNPLGMTQTYIRPQETQMPWTQVARGYYDYRKEGILQDLTSLYTGDGKGFTGIYSNVNDLRIFTNALFKSKTLLSTAMYNEMTTLFTLDETLQPQGACKVMQINVNGKTYTWYGHPGGEVNYAAGAFYCPEKNATITFNVNYGVAFTEMGAYTDAYYNFRKWLFEEVSK